jgi:CDP-diacylglycerol--serine O-phosphatidyltransferase
MVSNIRYYSGKDINLRRSVPFIVVAGVALAFAVIALDPASALFGLFLCYAISGYVLAGIGLMRRRRPVKK